MLPVGEYDEDDADVGFDVETQPSLTYAMQLSDIDGESGIFLGKVDEEDALRQAIMKILHTERYEHGIYSWNYGVEFKDLRGMPLPYVMSEVKDRIEDALLADDRIESVEDFTVERCGKKALHVTFTVIADNSMELDIETEVDIGG